MGEFVSVARVFEVPLNSARCFSVGGRRIAVYNLDGEFFATDDACTHEMGSLGEGEISGDEIVCPLHFATFNIRTGHCTGGPAFDHVRIYPVRVVGDAIHVEID
jgi:nitrite reductase/ring-hydroxylating ferredoxin subunit